VVSDEAQVAKLVLVPSGVGDHCPQGSNREVVAKVVVGHHHSPAIGMSVDSMAASSRPLQEKTVRVKGSNELARGRAARRRSYIDRHRRRGQFKGAQLGVSRDRVAGLA